MGPFTGPACKRYYALYMNTIGFGSFYKKCHFRQSFLSISMCTLFNKGSHSSKGILGMTCKFTAPTLSSRPHRITSLAYSPNGEDILVSYSSEYIYLFGSKVLVDWEIFFFIVHTELRRHMLITVIVLAVRILVGPIL